jgi:hypothetical protein
MGDIDRFIRYIVEASATGIFRTPEANAFYIPHVDVHRLSAHRTLRAVFYAGFIKIVDNELAGADLTDVAPFACSGLAEVIPRNRTATRASDVRFSSHKTFLRV